MTMPKKPLLPSHNVKWEWRRVHSVQDYIRNWKMYWYANRALYLAGVYTQLVKNIWYFPMVLFGYTKVAIVSHYTYKQTPPPRDKNK